MMRCLPLLIALLGLAALPLADSPALAQRAGRAPEFALGEAVQFRSVFGELHRGVVREHSGSFGYRVEYHDRHGWSRDEWVREEKLGRAPPRGSGPPSVGQEIEFWDAFGDVQPGTVREHRPARGYRVAYRGRAGMPGDIWIGDEQIVNYSVTKRSQGEFDLAPLYQAIGAATCPLTVVLIVVFMLIRRWTRSPVPATLGHSYPAASYPQQPGNPFASPPTGNNPFAPLDPGNPFRS